MRDSGSRSGPPVDILDPATRALVALAVAIATGREDRIAERAREALVAHVSPMWVDELLLQSVLMLGYPRALAAAAVWRRVSDIRAPAADPAFAESPEDWLVRGESTCRTVYGANYDRLRDNIRALHPALDAWMVLEGYGRVLSRPGLDLARRELCTVAQVAVLRSPRQLHSHLRGALHAGASPTAVRSALELAGADANAETMAEAMDIWKRLES